MSKDKESHLRLIKDCLAKLKPEAEIIKYEVLQGGISGSYTYHINLASEEVVLKATMLDAESYIVQRAQREAALYQDLADRIPLSVPRVLSIHTDDTHGIYLLLAAYQPSPPPAKWDEARYIEMAQQLGRFHATFWDKTDTLTEFRWLRRREQESIDTEIQNAYSYWQNLKNEQRFENVLTVRYYRLVHELLKQIKDIELVIQSLPLTLCHGDCHIDNLLEDTSGNLIWSDWQEVGLGRGPEDLSFFFQRARASDGKPPYDKMINAYQSSLEAVVDKEVPLVSIQRVIDGFELRTRLLHWPAYLVQAPEERVADMLHRIEELADRFLRTKPVFSEKTGFLH
jgi:aminoglycoside phosphotransferase (APT) family kinase protein